MYCPNCGKANADSAGFCIYCGTSLAPSSPPGKSTQRLKGSLSASLSSERPKDPFDNNTLRTKTDMEKPSGVVQKTVFKSTVGRRAATNGTTTVSDSTCKKCGRELKPGEKCPVCSGASETTSVPVTPIKTRKNTKAGWLIASIALVLVLITVIIIMSKHTTESADYPSTSLPEGYSAEYSSPLKYGFSADGIYKMRESGGETWTCRISVPAWSSTGEEELKAASSTLLNPKYNYLKIVDTTKYGDFVFQKISKSKDQMIISGITSVHYTEILESGYTIPYIFGSNGDRYYRRSIGYLVGGVNEDFETINGDDPSVVLKNRSGYANIIRAEKGSKFTIGYYSGTSFISDTYTADYFYCVRGDYVEWKYLPTEKTHEGYFIVDYSSLSPGMYLFDIGDYHHTIIEIVN